MTLPGTPALDRPLSVRRSELRDDLLACWLPVRPETTDAWLTRPSIARRVAAMVTELIPAGTDRILAEGHGATALGMAVALDSGLPFAVVAGRHRGAAGGAAATGSTDDGVLPGGTADGAFGTVRRGERVVVLSPMLAPSLGAAVAADYEALGVTVTVVIGVVPEGEQAGTGAASETRVRLVFDSTAWSRQDAVAGATPTNPTTTEQPS